MAHEVATALEASKTDGVRVIPVLVQGAMMLTDEELGSLEKPALRSLGDHNAHVLRDAAWDQDLVRLLEVIGEQLGRDPDRPAEAAQAGSVGPLVGLVELVDDAALPRVGDLDPYRLEATPDGLAALVAHPNITASNDALVVWLDDLDDAEATAEDIT